MNESLAEEANEMNYPLSIRGAIDPLDEIAYFCEHHKLWLHVDGARTTPASTGT